MIADSQTNFVFLADTLLSKYPKFSAEFEALLRTVNVKYGFLPQTKDIWAVDYMPIQIKKNEFISFKYYPDYLTDTVKWRKTISDTDLICKSIGLKVRSSNIIVDGGNVIRNENKVIMCDKVFLENPNLKFNELNKALENLFQVNKVVFIPTHPLDRIGHADGLVRFYNNDTVLINDFSKEDERYEIALTSALKNAGLDYIKIPYNPYKNKNNIDATGIYINYLETENTLFLPVFDMDEDEITVKNFEEFYPNHKILTINSRDLAKNGGILNCITWNILKS